MKKQKNIRLSDRSWEKVAWLGARYGTDTTAIEIAIDQLYEKEKSMTEKLYTHEYIGETFGNDPFLIHENKFDEYVAELVDQLGDDWQHDLSHDDGYGNQSYAEIVEHRADEIENGMIELPFDADGQYVKTNHVFRVIGNAVEFVK